VSCMSVSMCSQARLPCKHRIDGPWRTACTYALIPLHATHSQSNQQLWPQHLANTKQKMCISTLYLSAAALLAPLAMWASPLPCTTGLKVRFRFRPSLNLNRT